MLSHLPGGEESGGGGQLHWLLPMGRSKPKKEVKIRKLAVRQCGDLP